MLEDWISAGFAPETFWRQTPRLVGIAFAGHAARLKREGERGIVLAHNIALLMRTQKLPDLRSLISLAPSKPQTADEQWAIFVGLAAANSGPSH